MRDYNGRKRSPPHKPRSLSAEIIPLLEIREDFTAESVKNKYIKGLERQEEAGEQRVFVTAEQQTGCKSMSGCLLDTIKH